MHAMSGCLKSVMNCTLRRKSWRTRCRCAYVTCCFHRNALSTCACLFLVNCIMSYSPVIVNCERLGLLIMVTTQGRCTLVLRDTAYTSAWYIHELLCRFRFFNGMCWRSRKRMSHHGSSCNMVSKKLSVAFKQQAVFQAYHLDLKMSLHCTQLFLHFILPRGT